jgi:hypothetical protein
MLAEQNVFMGSGFEKPLGALNGEASTWKYSLVQHDADLHVHLLSTANLQSTDADRDLGLARAFLQALAFTHGKHAWPSSLQHRRDGKVVAHELTIQTSARRCPDAPFSEDLAFSAKINHGEWDFRRALQCAYEFFSVNTPLSTTITHILFLLRESYSPGVVRRVRLLALCGLFENLIDLVYRECCALDDLSHDAEFKVLRTNVLRTLKRDAASSDAQSSYKRLVGIIEGAASSTPRERYNAVLRRLGFSQNPRWSSIFKDWRAIRNPLAHSIAENEDSKETFSRAMEAESRFVGVINCVVLRLMGYSGPVCIGARGKEVGWLRPFSKQEGGSPDTEPGSDTDGQGADQSD